MEAQSSGRAILPPAPDRRLPLRREMSSRRDREDREKKEPNPADQATEEVNQVKPEVIEE